MILLVVLAAVVAWYVLRGLARWWAPAGRLVRRWSPYTLRAHAWVLAAPATFAYIGIFTASTVLQRSAPPRLIDLLTKIQSTNLHHLSLAPVEAMATSALWVADKGAGLSFYVVLYAGVVAWAEPRYGTGRLVLIGLCGHVFGSLLTAWVEYRAIQVGKAPERLAFTTDVGVSYIMVAGCAAAVLLMRGWWRWAGRLAIAAGVVLPVVVFHSLWNLGHLFATLSGGVVSWVVLRIAPARDPVDLRSCLAGEQARLLERAGERLREPAEPGQ